MSRAEGCRGGSRVELLDRLRRRRRWRRANTRAVGVPGYARSVGGSKVKESQPEQPTPTLALQVGRSAHSGLSPAHQPGRTSAPAARWRPRGVRIDVVGPAVMTFVLGMLRLVFIDRIRRWAVLGTA